MAPSLVVVVVRFHCAPVWYYSASHTHTTLSQLELRRPPNSAWPRSQLELRPESARARLLTSSSYCVNTYSTYSK
eukprot:1299622-Prymnesium_polylepis.1